MNLFDAIFKHDSIDQAAILYEQRAISYHELRHETLAMAACLSRLGIERGERVALLLNDSPEFVESFIAICSLGAIAVPINMGLRPDEQYAILKDCTPRAIVAEASIAKTMLADFADKLPSLEHLIAVSRSEEEKQFATETPSTQRSHREEQTVRLKLWDLQEVKAELAGSPESSTSEQTFPEPADGQATCIYYTSGSTGEPKGAIHRQSDLFYTNETYCREVLQLRDGDRLFSSSRLPFAYGLGNAFTFPLMNGRTTILCREKPNAEIISRIFVDYRPTMFFGVPVIFRLLLDHHQKVAPLDCSSLRLFVSAGEALPAHLGEECEKTFGVEVLDGIGSTEMMHMWMSNHQGAVRYGSSGKVLKGYEAKLLDPNGQPTPPGQEGNLWVKGESAAIGYWQKPEVTAMTFVDGWVRTGDLYRQDQDEYWYHMGRSDDCFKSSGLWVSPVEVEGVLLRHDGISRAAVVEDFDGDGLPCACAFVVQAEKGDRSALEKSLRELARASLPRFKQPRRYVFVDEMPYTATGKIQRFKLREALKESPKSRVQSPKSAIP